MSIIVSVKDSLYNEGDRYDLSVEANIEPMDYMGKVRFENVKVNGSYFSDNDNVRFYGNILGVGEHFVEFYFTCKLKKLS